MLIPGRIIQQNFQFFAETNFTPMSMRTQLRVLVVCCPSVCTSLRGFDNFLTQDTKEIEDLSEIADKAKSQAWEKETKQTLTFINDLFYWVTQCKLHAYADDHQLYSFNVVPVALEDCICRGLRVANEWYRSNRMIVNEIKHQAIVLGRTGHPFSFPLKDSLDIFGINIDNSRCVSIIIYQICLDLSCRIIILHITLYLVK